MSIIVDVGDYDAARFAKWLKTTRENYRPKLSITDLAEKADVSKQYISLLEKGADHHLTNKPVQPALDKVERLAIALDADINEARRAAGYEPIALASGDTHEIVDGVKISFDKNSKLNKLQKTKLIESARLIAVGLKRAAQEETEPLTPDPELEGVWRDSEGRPVATPEGIENLKRTGEIKK